MVWKHHHYKIILTTWYVCGSYLVQLSIILPTILKLENFVEVGSEKPQHSPNRSSPQAPLCWLPVLLHALVRNNTSFPDKYTQQSHLFKRNFIHPDTYLELSWALQLKIISWCVPVTSQRAQKNSQFIEIGIPRSTPYEEILLIVQTSILHQLIL